ncbi:DUF1801 domain-containing protein [Cryomorpha ignava]|uniref:DUF1801 domain-containing protein n=1 Tax=Cryomorpha ignava TaxID=101383 RepID=A0A7K3WKQ1_9FLAO|nr:DUF1801 domain-containing protein [Cryomorpha ignava]NEN22223.1 DUF1801 domain-containing protein [Cryomorpha ignava]
MKELDNFYLNQQEPLRSCYLALRQIILDCDAHITPEWKFRLPFFYYKGKMLCYLWKDKNTNEPYIGFMDGMKMVHPALEQGDRSRVRIFRINPDKDIDKKEISDLIKSAISVNPNYLKK